MDDIDYKMLHLVELVSKHRVLWNPLYSNLEGSEKQREDALSQISKVLCCSPQDISTNWDHMALQYRTEKDKILNSSGEYDSKWFAFHDMKRFMDEAIEAESLLRLGRIDFSTICRSCFRQDKKGLMFDVFSIQLGENFQSFTEFFMSLTGIVIDENDKLPANVCGKCFSKMEKIVRFKEHACIVQVHLKALQEAKEEMENYPDFDEMSFKEEVALDNNESEDEPVSDEKKHHVKGRKKPRLRRTPKKAIFKCEYCEKQFKNQIYFTKHVTSHGNTANLGDTQPGKKQKIAQHQCEVCGMRFRDNQTLNFHSLIHTGEKPYKCDICDKRFRQSSTMRFHKTRHSEKQLKCPECGMAFFTKRELLWHSRTHTGKTFIILNMNCFSGHCSKEL